jgi:hypothetical protein
MCGRATYKLTWEEIVALYRLTLDQPPVNTRARYNVCPTERLNVRKSMWRLTPENSGGQSPCRETPKDEYRLLESRDFYILHYLFRRKSLGWPVQIKPSCHQWLIVRERNTLCVGNWL